MDAAISVGMANSPPNRHIRSTVLRVTRRSQPTFLRDFTSEPGSIMSQIPDDDNDTKAPRRLLALLACTVFAVTAPAIAWCQISVSAMPEHARASRFGGGWEWGFHDQ
jgi:hypothetical protein